MAETLLQQGQIDGLVSALNGKANWHIGQIVPSALPITDAGLHLLDGTLISGSGTYAAFVDYIGDLYDSSSREVVWTQPILTSDGTLGGNDFAVSANTVLPGSAGGLVYGSAYYAFDGTANNAWHGAQNVFPADLVFYNPKPLKVTKLTITNWTYSAATGMGTGTVYGSNDNSTWTTLTTFTNSSTGSGVTWEIDLASNTNFYKYYKIQCSSSTYTYAVIGEVKIDATYIEHSAFCTENEWQQSLTDYGVCGKFVYDSVNNTVRLPKITGIIEGTTDTTTLGDLVAAGLPNITGSITGSGDRTSFPGATGAFYGEGSTGTGSSSGSVQGYSTVYLNASRSSSIYKDSFNKVQPQTIKTLYYICIATSTKTDIQVDIDQIASDLNGKADVDLTNCTKPHIVETYVNGTSWYRVYSDGWCEQGGGFVNNTDITFLKEYEAIPSVFCSPTTTDTTVTNQGLCISKLSISGFHINTGSSWSGCWQASGYIR